MNTLYSEEGSIKLPSFQETDLPTNRPTDQATDGHEESKGSYSSINRITHQKVGSMKHDYKIGTY